MTAEQQAQNAQIRDDVAEAVKKAAAALAPANEAAEALHEVASTITPTGGTE